MRNPVLLLVLLLAGCASAQPPVGATGNAAGATPEHRKNGAKAESPEAQKAVPVETEQPGASDGLPPKPKEYYIEED